MSAASVIEQNIDIVVAVIPSELPPDLRRILADSLPPLWKVCGRDEELRYRKMLENGFDHFHR